MKQDIIKEYTLRSSNNKKDMLDLLEDYVINFFGLPLGIDTLERNEKQMSYNIFNNYICFDYQESRIEVRYKNGNHNEEYAGDIIFGNAKPSWETVNGGVVDFELSKIDNIMEKAFKIKD